MSKWQASPWQFCFHCMFLRRIKRRTVPVEMFLNQTVKNRSWCRIAIAFLFPYLTLRQKLFNIMLPLASEAITVWPTLCQKLSYDLHNKLCRQLVTLWSTFYNISCECYDLRSISEASASTVQTWSEAAAVVELRRHSVSVFTFHIGSC